MLLEDFAKLDKRWALKLQTALLDHPYGDHLDIELESSVWQEAFDGTNIKLGPDVMDAPVIIVRVNDRFDSERTDPYGPNPPRAIITHNSVAGPRATPMAIYYVADMDEPNSFKHYNSADSPEELIRITSLNLLKHFIVTSHNVVDTAEFKNHKIDKAEHHGLTIGCENQLTRVKHYYRIESALPPPMIEVGQVIIAKDLVESTILKINKIEVGAYDDGVVFNTLKDVFDEYDVNTVSQLLKTSDGRYLRLACENVSTGANVSLRLEKRSAVPAWFWGQLNCSLRLLKQV